MSEYRNFVKDFPGRCNELLSSSKKSARYPGHEVTLMLAVASAGFVIPFERLRNDHPFNDRKTVENIKKYNQSLSKDVCESCLWDNCQRQDWKYVELTDYKGDKCITDPPDYWKQLRTDASPPPPTFEQFAKQNRQVQVCQVLSCIRNALAHGNIHTRGGPTKQIEQIVFVSNRERDKDKRQWWCLQCPPGEFLILLKNWFDFIKNLDLTGEMQSAA